MTSNLLRSQFFALKLCILLRLQGAAPFFSYCKILSSPSAARQLAFKAEKALEALDVKPGDVVRTDCRGERRGHVKAVTTTKEQVARPPKVIFERERPGQPSKEMAHNPSTLEKVE